MYSLEQMYIKPVKFINLNYKNMSMHCNAFAVWPGRKHSVETERLLSSLQLN